MILATVKLASVGLLLSSICGANLQAALADEYRAENSSTALMHYHQAESYLERHEYEKAVQECTSALALFPSQSVDILLTRARAFGRLNQSRKAMEDLEEARRLAREQQPTYHLRVKQSQESGRTPIENKADRLVANPEDFGGVAAGFIRDGESGLKTIGFGKQFYIVGETNESVFKTTSTASHETSGWAEWRTKLCRVVTSRWRDTYPGQAQGLVTISKNGNLSIEWLSYIPGVGKENKILVSKDSRQLFEKSVEKCFVDLNGSKDLSFPPGSTATEVVALAHFVSDLNMYVDLDDLSLLDGLPNTEKDVHIARICSILDAQPMYDLADHFRKQLPPRLQHHFSQANRTHGVYAIWPYTGSGALGSPPSLKLVHLSPDCYSYIEKFIDDCLSTKQYLKAEAAARWTIWASHSDSIFQMFVDKATTKEWVQHWEQEKLGTVPKLTKVFDTIDGDLLKPKFKIERGQNLVPVYSIH